MARLTQKSLDDAFARGGSATDAYENIKNRDAALRNLITGKQMDQESIAANFEAADQAARDAGLKPGKYSVNASVGQRSYNPENEGLMGLLGLQARQEEQDEKKVTGLGDRITKSNIPRQITTMRGVETATRGTDAEGRTTGGILSNPDYEVKSAGPILNYVPDVLKGAVVGAGEKLGMLPQGAAAESRALQELINVDTKEMSGVAVTKFEEARNRLKQGLAGGADPSLVKTYAQQAHQALQEMARNVESSYNPKIRERYKKYGGSLPSEELNFGAPAAGQQDPRSRLEILREKRRRGEI